MASKHTPSTASNDWLFQATAKLRRSIYRQAEYNYKGIIKNLKKQHNQDLTDLNEEHHRELETLEQESVRLELLCKELMEKVKILEGRSEKYEKPDEVKSKENVPSLKIELPKETKRKIEYTKEIDEILFLRDAPPNKILKVLTPVAKRSLPPPPVTPKTSKITKKHERSTSPQPSSPVQDPLSIDSRPTISPQHSPDDTLQLKRMKKKKEKDKL